MTTEELPRERGLRQRTGYRLLLGGLTLWVADAALVLAALGLLG